jgi:cytidylate kinase
VKKPIVIYGGSCTGKTSVASSLAKLTGMATRHCGQLVWERARVLNLSSAEELPDEEHRAIDSETQRLAAMETPVIIEGRFLDQVLGECGRVLFVHLTCNRAVRQERLEASRPRTRVAESIEQRDKADAHFRSRHYLSPSNFFVASTVTLDTTWQSIDECAKAIMRHFARCSNDEV